MRLLRQLQVVVLVPSLVAGCKDSPTEPGLGAPATVIAEGGAGVIAVGDTILLSARVVDARGRLVPGAAVAWRSLAPDVATVDATGRVVGEDAGTAGIVVQSGAAADTVRFAVEIVPRSITLEVGSTTGTNIVYVGTSVNLRATVHDGRGRPLAGLPVSYSVTDTQRATAPVFVSAFGYATSSITDGGPITFIAQSGALRSEVTVEGRWGVSPTGP